MELNWYFRITITIIEDNPESKIYRKHVRMQVMLIVIWFCNLLRLTSKTFSPLCGFELVHISLSLEFRHRFAFRLDYSLTGLVRPLLKINKQHNVIFTKLAFTFFVIYIWEECYNSEGKFLSRTHRIVRESYTLKSKMKSLI